VSRQRAALAPVSQNLPATMAPAKRAAAAAKVPAAELTSPPAAEPPATRSTRTRSQGGAGTTAPPDAPAMAVDPAAPAPTTWAPVVVKQEPRIFTIRATVNRHAPTKRPDGSGDDASSTRFHQLLQPLRYWRCPERT